MDKTLLEQSLQEQAERRQRETYEREMFLGSMTGWRTMRNNSRRTTILQGRHKVLSLVARARRAA